MARRRTAGARRGAVLLCALAALTACNGIPVAAPADPQEAPTGAERTSSVFAAVQELADGAVAGGSVPGLAVAVRVGDQRRVVVAGTADERAGVRLAPEHRFAVASVTKPMVAAAVLRLVEQHRLRLDQTVEELLPGLLPRGDEITVQQLLRHSSGLVNYAVTPGFAPLARSGRATARQLVALSAAEPLQFPPGEGFAYSNTNYVVLGLVVAHVTGRPLPAAMHDLVFAPAGMAGATMGRRHAGAPLAHGYLGHQDVTRSATALATGDGGVVATTADTRAFLDALVGGRLLGPQLLGAMEADATGPLEGWDGYGLGLAREYTRCGVAFGHTGLVGGYVTEAWALADGSRSVVAAANRAESVHARGPLAPVVAAALCG